MAKKRSRLPRSLLEAVKKGEEIGKKQGSPRLKKLQERLDRNIKEFNERYKNDPAFRIRFRKVLDLLGEEMDARSQAVAKLNGVAQRFLVLEDFVHKTDERFVYSRHLIGPEDREIQYAKGVVLTLRPVQFHADHEGRKVSYWGWLDADGWIIRDGVLDGYELGRKLKKYSA